MTCKTTLKNIWRIYLKVTVEKNQFHFTYFQAAVLGVGSCWDLCPDLSLETAHPRSVLSLQAFLSHALEKPRAAHTAPAAKHRNLAALNLALGNLRSHFHFSYKSSLWIESIKDLMFSMSKLSTEHWWLASNNPIYCKIIKYLVNTRKLNYIKSLQLKQGYSLDFCLYLIFRLWQ